MEMTLSERYAHHAKVCDRMAEENRRDAETATGYWRQKWLQAAERLEAEAEWYREHAEMFSDKQEEAA